MIRCKGCNAEIDAEEDELDEGDTITCDECGADQRVLSIDPFDLELLEEDEEDEEEGDLDEDEDEEFPK